MGKKKIKYEGKLIGETDYYYITEHDATGYELLEGKKGVKVFKLYHKNNDTVITCTKYEIKGPAVVYVDVKSEDGKAIYYNEDKMQKYGMGSVPSMIFEIDSWQYKKVAGNKELVIKYTDTSGRKFVRIVDENGDVYKKRKTVQQTEEETVTI